MIETKNELEKFITQNWRNVNSYLDAQAQNLELPIYSSVDIRESKNKVAPVDNNIYPAGFNNICTFDLIMASEKFKKFILKNYPEVKTIGIIPESNTKNAFYLDHLATLKSTLEKAGYSVNILSLDQTLFNNVSSLELTSHSEGKVLFQAGAVKNNRIIDLKSEESFDLIILNHDQSSKIEIPWIDIKNPVTPSPFIGWYQRQKTQHFKFYHDVVNNFAKEFGINPSLMEADFDAVDHIDFATKDGLDRLADHVDELLKRLPEHSKVFIKASQGTYGMGIHVVSSGEEVRNLNRKKRNKLDIGKNNIKFSSVLIQEGIETVLKYDEYPAEITIYLIGGESVGGFLRTNTLKGVDDNLNSKGMIFQKFCISEIQENADHKAKEALYSVISRLSTLASGLELAEIKKQ